MRAVSEPEKKAEKHRSNSNAIMIKLILI